MPKQVPACIHPPPTPACILLLSPALLFFSPLLFTARKGRKKRLLDLLRSLSLPWNWTSLHQKKSSISLPALFPVSGSKRWSLLAPVKLFTDASQCISWISILNLFSTPTPCELWSRGERPRCVDALFQRCYDICLCIAVSLKCQISIAESRTRSETKALGHHWWLRETKAKTRSLLCSWYPPGTCPNWCYFEFLFYFIAIIPCICCQLHHQNASLHDSSWV